MPSRITKFALLTLAILVMAGMAYSAYAISQLPESEFVKKLSVPQLAFTEYDSFEEAITELNEQIQDFLTSPVNWTSERGDISLTPQEMGATAQISEIENYLENFFQETSIFTRTKIYLLGQELENPLNVDQLQTKEAFSGSGIEQGNNNASFASRASSTNANGTEVYVVEEQIGYGVDTDQIEEILDDYWSARFTMPASSDLPLTTSDPEIRQEVLELMLSSAQSITNLDFELLNEWGGTWDIDMADHIDWLIPATSTGPESSGGPEPPDTTFLIKKSSLGAYLNDNIAGQIESDPTSVTITENEDGSYDFDGSARFGKLIDADTLQLEIESTINNYIVETVMHKIDGATGQAPETDHTIAIPIITIAPEVYVPDSLAARGITDLLEFGYTNFSGSPYNRIYNVNYGMSIFDGIVISQGEEFSFTTLLGPVDGAHGWLEELVILGDETKPEYGGGLCQVSSTMYRAALYSGLDITSRKEHSYAVSYYAYPNGYGLDATVYQPWPDLRFVNDTPGDVLVQGYTEGAYAYFVFYGTNDERSVQMEGPYYHSYVEPPESETSYTTELEPGVRELDSHEHTGFQVEWYRTVTYGDGTEGERENIHTYYEARPEKWLEGTPEEEREETRETVE
jgi:hypothetical protein